MLPIGVELLNRGHRVTFYGLSDAEDACHKSGIPIQAIGVATCPKGAVAEQFERLGKLTGMAAFRFIFQLFAEDTRIILSDLPLKLKDASVDCLLVDQSSASAGSVAEALEIPFISISNALLLNEESRIPPFFTSWRYDPSWLGRIRNKIGYSLYELVLSRTIQQINTYRSASGLVPLSHSNEAFSDLAQISQLPFGFDYPRKELPRCFHFAGPFQQAMHKPEEDEQLDYLDGRPLIYASLGTVQNRIKHIYSVIAASCTDLNVQLVISLGGGLSPHELPPLPGSPVVLSFAPQLALLRRTELVITHAGLNTTLESLSNAVPMVAIPLASEQPGVAARIEWLGVGEVIPPKSLSVSLLKETIQKVLYNKSYKRRATLIQSAILASGGAVLAADISEDVACTHLPVIAPIQDARSA
jgi:zeaxanthin glucosyltransferase